MAAMTREYRACQACHGLEIVTAARQEQLNALSPELSDMSHQVMGCHMPMQQMFRRDSN